jgi:integrase
MARAIHQLTPERAKFKSKKPGLHRDGGGLFLSVKPPKAASWVFRYMLNGRAREMGLGSFPEVSLPAAREKADEARKLKAAGMDPIEARNDAEAARKLQQATAMTFRQCAQACIESRRDGWKNAKHAKQWEATLTAYAYPHFGDLPVGSVDTGLLVKALEPIWKPKTETASRVRGRIEVILDWAKTRGYRQGENPARWRGHLENLFAARSTVQTVEHHPALPYPGMAAFWADLSKEEGIAPQALRFTILTAARTDQTIKARWSEIDFDNAIWTIPGGRMKGRRGKEREHRVPLSKLALAVVNEQRKATGGEGYIFPGQKPKKPLSNMAMAKVLERMKRDDITVHGFRSSFRDWAEETTNFAGSVAEAALAHVVGDKVEAAYRRGDLFEKRRKLMAAWASYCTTPHTDAKVTPLRAAG